MRTYDLICKKRNGFNLNSSEIDFLIKGYSQGTIPDYQMAALVMAIYFNGLSKEETLNLTHSMVASGESLDLSEIKGTIVDKHSTGGVGDSTTIILAPLIAAAGIPVAKMSGRGLGHTGGTIDKLEAIPGLKTELEIQEFIRQVNKIGIAVIGQTGNLVPADKKLYALRDVTATVDSLPLIAASVMSKKIAAGAKAILLDVKVGSGAFMKNEKQAYELAKLMVEIGQGVNRPTAAVISAMDQPLGYAVGNALEVKEAVQTLQGSGPEDLTNLCLFLGAQLLKLAGRVKETEQGEELLRKLLVNGQALNKFAEFIEAQGGKKEIINNLDLLPTANKVMQVVAGETGYVSRIDALQIGTAAMTLGAGRETKDDQLDQAAGIVLLKKAGDQVEKGEILAYVHTNDLAKGDTAVTRVLEAYQIAGSRPASPPLIYEVIS